MFEPLSAERRAEIRKRCDAATLPPTKYKTTIRNGHTHADGCICAYCDFERESWRDLPACLDEIDRLESRLEKAEAALPHPDLCTLSLIWHEFAGGRVREDTEQRVNEWLKARIAKEKH